jgi:hypothetical protein
MAMLIIAFAFTGSAQVYQNTSNYGNQFKRLRADSVVFMPVVPSVANLSMTFGQSNGTNNYDRPGAIAYVRSINSFYQYDSAGVWVKMLNENDPLFVGIDSLIQARVKYSDSATLYVTITRLQDSMLAIRAYGDSLHEELADANMTVTGDDEKTITVTKKSTNAWLQASFHDNDNQTLSLGADDSLGISGGNKIKLPYIRALPGERIDIFSGTTSTTQTLTYPPISNKNVDLYLNNAWVSPDDYSITGSTLTLDFAVEVSDQVSVYYKYNQ